MEQELRRNCETVRQLGFAETFHEERPAARMLYYALDCAGPDAASVTHGLGMQETAARRGEW